MNILLAAEETESGMAEEVPIFNIVRPEKRARILYVDDDASIRQSGKEVLERQGYEVDVAADGDDGMAAIHHQSYDLIITDQNMPRLTGAEMIIRTRRSGLRVPVMITSEVWGTGPVAEARPHISAVLPKPFAARELVETVKRVLDRNVSATPAEIAIRSLIKKPSSSTPMHRNWGINE